MTPDFAEFLQQTPTADRSVLVFKLVAKTTGLAMSTTAVSRIVSMIGEKQVSSSIKRPANSPRRMTCDGLTATVGPDW